MDEFDVLAAIWILACNDENSHMSYAGIEHRVHPPSTVDVRRLVADHGELFRLRMPKPRLEAWKRKVVESGRMPSWLGILPQAERRAALDKLTHDDFFRSQFRAEEDARKSELEVLKWGLEHIDRLRKARAEAREGRFKRLTSLWLPMGALVVSLVTVASSMLIQRQTLQDQRFLKRYEIGFAAKQGGYSNVIVHLTAGLDSALLGRPGAEKEMANAEQALIQIEPFLSSDGRQRVLRKVEAFSSFIRGIPVEQRNQSAGELREKGLALRAETSTLMFQLLFPDSES